MTIRFEEGQSDTTPVSGPLPDGRPLKVCFPFTGSRLGGSHLSTLLLARNLDRRQFEPVILVHRDGPLMAHLLDQGIPFTRLPDAWILEFRARTALRDGLRLFTGTLAAARFLKAQGIAIVHTNDNRMNTTWAPAARLAGCRFVWHQRTRPILTRRMRLVARLADHIICISHYSGEAFQTGAFKDRLSIVNNPFALPTGPSDKAAAKSRLLSELGLTPGTRLVAFVANLLPHKRPQVFVEAARAIVEGSTQPVAFPVFGEAQGEHYHAMTRRIAELGLQARFHFVGFRNPIEPCIAACDLLLSPSIEEGYGRTLIEAMLNETPVVAADSGGYREIVQQGITGILVEPDDASAFAAAALSVLEHPKRAAEFTQAASAYARKNLDINSHVQQVMRIYRDLTAPTQPAQQQGPAT